MKSGLAILLFPNFLISSGSLSPENMDSIVHFEIPADDPKRAGEFYKEAFGWNIQAMPEMNYTMISTTPSDESGTPTKVGMINGGMPQRGQPIDHTVVTIQVQSIDDALTRVEKLGGKRFGDKMPVGDMGWAAYFKDTEGNTVGLWQSSGQMM